MTELSVVVCTHNPRRDYLGQVVNALKQQTMAGGRWELVIVDNASATSLQDELVAWKPNARIVRESRLGLTWARVCGIRESSGELIVLCDDDNVLDQQYLEAATEIGRRWPYLGAWGGEQTPVFEEQPPAWTRRCWGNLALRRVPRDVWSNLEAAGTTPVGAGMVVRRQVAERYASLVTNDPRRQSLDRRGRDLMSGGDIDLAHTAIDMGLGTGLFKQLRLQHLIPKERLSEEYLLRLEEQVAFCGVVLADLRGYGVPSEHRSILGQLLDKLRLLRMRPQDRRFELARRRGRESAFKWMQRPRNP